MFATLVEFAARGRPCWWLYASRCAACDQRWLVAQEERQNDIFILRRLTRDEAQWIADGSAWPRDFDRYEVLLRIGRDAGKAVRWVDPQGSSLLPTIVDVAREHPGISESELASLLNLDSSTTQMLCKEAVRTEGVQIASE